MSESNLLLRTTPFFCAALLFLAACGGGGEGGENAGPDGPAQPAPADVGKPGETVVIEREVNGTSVTCARVYHVDVNDWPPEGYPVGASGFYRYESEGIYLGPTDGRLPDGTPTGFRLTREGYEGSWTLMSTAGPGGDAQGYPWDNQRSPTDCPDGNSTWNNGAKVAAH